jgi:CRISPR-associated endonuclease/helicase Cas3
MAPDAALMSRLIAAAESGAQVAVICNLVDVAQGLYENLRVETNGLPIEIELFHARFRFLDRQDKEKGVIRNFGLEGKRDKGRILVATQVVEQSLDVDFDWIVTQLCPVDLLFQRLGRLHRHADNNDKRPSLFKERLCSVLLPTGEDYGGTGVVYANTRVLWRTEQKLLASEKVEFPDAYRNWIELVYQEEPWECEPEQIIKAYEKFEDDLFEARCRARQQIDSAINPFFDNEMVVSVMTRDGEMNMTVIPYMASGGGRQTISGESLESLDEYKLQEILMLNSIGVPTGWKGHLERMAKYDEGRYWLEMRLDGDGFVAEGNRVIFKYHCDTGLRREKK